MENASKALIIGAGVLFAVIILSVGILTYRNISGFYRQKEDIALEEELADFNSEFSVYQRELTGFELVSLINKIIDFNQRRIYGMSGTEEEKNEKAKDGYINMSIKVEITKAPNNDVNFFKNDTIEITGNNLARKSSSIISGIKEMQELESKIDSSDLTALASHATDFSGLSDGSDKFKELVVAIVGERYNNNRYITKNNILKYENYLAFKRGTFECNEMNSENGQITSFRYTQIK